VQTQGRTVFMSSHVLSEVERVCDRIALLRQGELVLLGTVDELKKVAGRQVRVRFAMDATLRELPPGCALVQTSPRAWTLRVEGPLGPLLRLLASMDVADLEIEEPRLEDVLIQYYRKKTP
jgi:ABC-2 type transport system ATP-binding protein